MQRGKRVVVYAVRADELTRRELGKPVNSALQGMLRRDGSIVELTVDKSSARQAVTTGLERVKLKYLHC
jgi:hypothetical protein